MFGLIKKIFLVLLRNIVNGSNHTKCVLLSSQKCKIQPTLNNLHPNEYSQECHYDPFAVKHDDRNKGIENISKAYIMQKQI